MFATLPWGQCFGQLYDTLTCDQIKIFPPKCKPCVFYYVCPVQSLYLSSIAMNPYFYPLPKHIEHKDCFQKSRQCLPDSVYCVSFIIGKPTPCDNNRIFPPNPPRVPAGARLSNTYSLSLPVHGRSYHTYITLTSTQLESLPDIYTLLIFSSDESWFTSKLCIFFLQS